MRVRKNRYFVGDFETTVYKGQKSTEVWASACVELFSENVEVFTSIRKQFDYFIGLDTNVVVYYHNLKFDGSFWLSFLIQDLQLAQGSEQIGDEIIFISPAKLKNNTFTYSISSMGQWYRIIIKKNGHILEIRDSFKLLPFSVDRIGKSFNTKHKKLSIEYEGFRVPDGTITNEEKEYIINDVLVVKEALEIMFTEGHNRLTIGSCCLAEYKTLIGGKTYDKYFPDIYKAELEENYGSICVGEYIRNSYHGGWCYLKKGCENIVYCKGYTADVNSLYPSMMHSQSGNLYPIGEPEFWSGNYIPEIAIDGTHYYFIRFKCRFYLKKGKLPFIQIKNTMLYKANEMLSTSAVYNSRDGKYYEQYYDINGELKECIVTLTMTMTDFKLFVEHYDLKDFEILDGCYFKGAIGIFDCYIDKYKKIKTESTGAVRELAKLFLNNLYGKMASTTISNFKVAYLKDDGVIGFYTQLANDKKAGYIPVGSAITSYARNFTIRAAQKNYKNFVYADTDSIHCLGDVKDVKGIEIHDKNFCCWKIESVWDRGLFVRQKTYIEREVVGEERHYNLKCAGMPERCKKLFLKSLGDNVDLSPKNSAEEIFLSERRELSDFKVGLIVPSKLLPKRIVGGIILCETTFEIR